MQSLLLALIIATTEGNPPSGNSATPVAEAVANPSSNQATPEPKNSENLNQAMDQLGESLNKSEKKKTEKAIRRTKAKSNDATKEELSEKKLSKTKEKPDSKPADDSEELKPEAKTGPAMTDQAEAAVDSATQIANEAAQLALAEAAKLSAIGSSELHQSLQTSKEIVNETVKTVKEALPLKEEKPALPPASEPARP